jgi:hypothetical protein
MTTSTPTSARIVESPGEQRDSAPHPLWPGKVERRIKFRYRLDLHLRYRCPSAGSLVSGEGLAVNVSSGGLLVASQHLLNVGTLVVMSIEWPFLLDGRTPLQLIAVGRVLRGGNPDAKGQDRYFAAAFERHEFRTMKSSIPSQSPAERSQNFDLIWSPDIMRSVPSK